MQFRWTGHGVEWSYVSYYMGSREVWVCLDDSLNERLDTDIVSVEPARLRGTYRVVDKTVRAVELLMAQMTSLGVRQAPFYLDQQVSN